LAHIQYRLISQNKVIASEPTATATGTIHGRINRPEAMEKLPQLNSTLITLNNGEYSTYSAAQDGSFTFHNIPPGVHVLDVHSNIYHFSQIKIQLIPSNDMEPNCIEYVYPGATKYSIEHPLLLNAHATYDYFEKRPSFSPFRIFKNPMVLMMIVSVGFMVIMPHMMSNLDPEQKEQMKKQMEMQQDPTKMLSQMWSDLSGKPAEESKRVVKKGTKSRLKRE
jgi:hypothetical protein